MADRVLATATGRVISSGFGFHPTDEELISYLKRKVQGKPMVLDAIEEVDVYIHDPTDLPEKSKMKTKDQEWFFFTTLDKLSTTKGNWHQTEADKEIKRSGDGHVIGKIKRLAFNRGLPPYNQPTNWVIHEYHLVDGNDGHGLKTDAAYVLCRVSHKELPREVEMDEDEPKTECLPPCVLNTEAPLPFNQYKRKRERDSFGSDDEDNSSQTIHQDSDDEMMEESEPEPVDTTMVSTG